MASEESNVTSPIFCSTNALSINIYTLDSKVIGVIEIPHKLFSLLT